MAWLAFFGQKVLLMIQHTVRGGCLHWRRSDQKLDLDLCIIWSEI